MDRLAIQGWTRTWCTLAQVRATHHPPPAARLQLRLPIALPARAINAAVMSTVFTIIGSAPSTAGCLLLAVRNQCMALVCNYLLVEVYYR